MYQVCDFVLLWWVRVRGRALATCIVPFLSFLLSFLVRVHRGRNFLCVVLFRAKLGLSKGGHWRVHFFLLFWRGVQRHCCGCNHGRKFVIVRPFVSFSLAEAPQEFKAFRGCVSTQPSKCSLRSAEGARGLYHVVRRWLPEIRGKFNSCLSFVAWIAVFFFCYITFFVQCGFPECCGIVRAGTIVLAPCFPVTREGRPVHSARPLVGTQHLLVQRGVGQEWGYCRRVQARPGLEGLVSAGRLSHGCGVCGGL